MRHTNVGKFVHFIRPIGAQALKMKRVGCVWIVNLHREVSCEVGHIIEYVVVGSHLLPLIY